MARSLSAAGTGSTPHGARVREVILDHAERLFAERGFHGTSIRDITERAGLRLASVNYHFGSKENLFRDVLMRRAVVLNQQRLTRLEPLERRAARGSRARDLRALREVVEAFVVPVAELALSSAGYRRYFALIAQVSSSRLPALALVAEHFNPVAERFVAALARIYGKAERTRLLYAYQLLLGTTLFAFSGNQRVEALARPGQHLDGPQQLAQSVIEFATPGVHALLSGKARTDLHLELNTAPASSAVPAVARRQRAAAPRATGRWR